MDSLQEMDLRDMNVLDEADIDNGVPAGYQDGDMKEELGNEEEYNEDEDSENLAPSNENDEVCSEVCSDCSSLCCLSWITIIQQASLWPQKEMEPKDEDAAEEEHLTSFKQASNPSLDSNSRLKLRCCIVFTMRHPLLK